MKKKRKSMRELKKYTGSASKKTKRDSNKFKDWSEEGKAANYVENDESDQG
jgi:hypothetical protein